MCLRTGKAKRLPGASFLPSPKAFYFGKNARTQKAQRNVGLLQKVRAAIPRAKVRAFGPRRKRARPKIRVRSCDDYPALESREESAPSEL